MFMWICPVLQTAFCDAGRRGAEDTGWAGRGSCDSVVYLLVKHGYYVNIMIVLSLIYMYSLHYVDYIICLTSIDYSICDIL